MVALSCVVQAHTQAFKGGPAGVLTGYKQQLTADGMATAEVERVIARLRQRALDLGMGQGRNTVFLAQ